MVKLKSGEFNNSRCGSGAAQRREAPPRIATRTERRVRRRAKPAVRVTPGELCYSSTMAVRTSDADKLFNGTAQPCRMRGDPPSPAITATPRPPRHLAGRAREHWKRLAPLLLGTVRQSDLPALEHFCTDLARLDTLRAKLEAEGESYPTVTASGAPMVRVRPEVSQEKAVAARVLQWFAHFETHAFEPVSGPSGSAAASQRPARPLPAKLPIKS